MTAAAAVQALERALPAGAPVQITPVDRENFTLPTPMLHGVACGGAGRSLAFRRTSPRTVYGSAHHHTGRSHVRRHARLHA